MGTVIIVLALPIGVLVGWIAAKILKRLGGWDRWSQ